MKKVIKTMMPILASMVFAISAHANDYAVTGSLEQAFDGQGIETIHIHCFCEAELVRTNSVRNEISLRVVGTLDSVGYHGPQEAPQKVPSELLSFDEMRNGSFLKLESREFTYIHHGYLIESLEIIVPETTKVILMRRNWGELSRRPITSRPPSLPNKTNP